VARRNWEKAREKVDREGMCRVCQKSGRLESAHVLDRRHDFDPAEVDPDDIVPLCQECHGKYDSRKLDLLPYMTYPEQAAAVRKVGILRSLNRLTSGKTKTADKEINPW
jgi:hypothetical protein